MSLLTGEAISKIFMNKSKDLFGKPEPFKAVNNVSISIEPGEIVGIVGESGSGKSTLGEILGGLQRPSEGKVCYQGQDISTLTKAQYADYRTNVQFIFQNPQESMDPHYKIKSILAEPLYVLHHQSYDQIKTKIETMMQNVGLNIDNLEKYPNTLSGGQCQRVAIARALLLNPKLLICDECVSALDVSVQASILNLLRKMQQEFKTAMLFISHDIGVVRYICDRVIVMKKGSVVEQGKAEEVVADPKDDYTKVLVASSTFERQV